MISRFENYNPILLSLLAGLFTWFVSALGAAMVFSAKKVKQKFLDLMLGFAAGIMIAASFWSLLAPAIEISKYHKFGAWFPSSTGFFLGYLVLRIFDKFLPHLHIGFPITEKEGIKTSWHRNTLLILAITLHNIPEGLALGVAFGSLAIGSPEISLSSAIALTIGISIQNFPEGIAVSMPLRRDGFSRFKSFWYGQLSAIVEPVASLLGALAVSIIKPILPYALSFAAGAMVFVVVEEVIPESQKNNNTDTATLGVIVGFITMMILDTTF